MPDLPSGTVTFLFTDIEGSTALWEQDRAGMRAAVERHLALLRTAIDGLIDRLIKELGPETKVVGTGGQANMIAKSSRHIHDIDEDITLHGLHLIWKRRKRP